MPKKKNLDMELLWSKSSSCTPFLTTQLMGIVLFSFIFGCAPKNTSPEAPMEEYLYTDDQIHSEKHLSFLNIPVRIPVQEIENQLNKSINGLIYEDKSYEDDNQDNLKAKIWKISPIKMVAIDSSFLFEVPLKIWASAGYKFSPLGITVSGYKDTEFSIKIRFISKIGVSRNWKLESETMVESFEWITEPNIQVAGFKIPVKSMISRILNRNSEKITDEIDKQVANGIELQKYAAEAWGLAQQPYLISQEYNTWLTLLPSAVIMTPLLAKNGVLSSTIGFKGYTQTITSESKPALGAVKKLPPLTIQNVVDDRFKVALISQVTYAEASRLASEQFKGKKFSFLAGKYNVAVTNLELYGQNHVMIIKVGLKGGINGDIYLKGIPKFDPDKKVLRLQQVDYDLDTKNSLVKTANWLFQGQFNKLLEKNMVFPLGDQIEETKSSLQSTLNNFKVTDGIKIKGQIENIVPDKVYLTPNHIIAVVFANGNVDLTVSGLK